METRVWRGTLGSEWIKFWSVRSTWWALASTVVLMALVSLVMGIDFAGDVEAGESADGLTLSIGEPASESVMLAQFGVVALAMLAMTTEFSTGSLRVTLTADPARGRVLAAKTIVVTAVTLVLGAVAACVGLAASAVGLGEYGTGGAGELFGDGVAIVLYLVLTAVLTVGVAAWIRSSAGTMSVVLTVMLALPMVAATTGAEYLPGRAGLILLDSDTANPLSPVAAVVVIAAWAALAQGMGYAALRRRDA
ncbi:ABC transporter permease [Streptomyces sp. RFCAC02]|uniref:ABC transporter permease n=1 Tax=Streptomyces sp. RFCAC02 TaxID=2499143 RepID=UPI00102117BD|nr:ABC transporter permease [Streptomyces sp. RFCAC02]